MDEENKAQKDAGESKNRGDIKQLYHVSVTGGLHYDCMATPALSLNEGDEVVLQCDRYRDYGVIVYTDGRTGCEKELEQGCRHSSKGRRLEGRRIPRIVRKANLQDKGRAHENDARAKSMYKTAVSKAAAHKLAMKIVNSHVSFDRKYVFFQFTSEEKVDFRDFLSDLSQALNQKVELRQIGVRDEAAMQGGMGICGRPFCCVSFLRDFANINVKMAKTQNLSLSPSTVSGACGRLKCCLRYEHDGYKQLQKEMPRRGKMCETPEGKGIVKDVYMLKQKVRVQLEDKNGQLAEFENSDVSPVDG